MRSLPPPPLRLSRVCARACFDGRLAPSRPPRDGAPSHCRLSRRGSRAGGAALHRHAPDRRGRRPGVPCRHVPRTSCPSRPPHLVWVTSSPLVDSAHQTRSQARSGLVICSSRQPVQPPASYRPWSGRLPRFHAPAACRAVISYMIYLSLICRSGLSILIDDINTMSFTTLLSAQIAEW